MAPATSPRSARDPASTMRPSATRSADGDASRSSSHSSSTWPLAAERPVAVGQDRMLLGRGRQRGERLELAYRLLPRPAGRASDRATPARRPTPGACSASGAGSGSARRSARRRTRWPRSKRCRGVGRVGRPRRWSLRLDVGLGGSRPDRRRLRPPGWSLVGTLVDPEPSGRRPDPAGRARSAVLAASRPRVEVRGRRRIRTSAGRGPCGRRRPSRGSPAQSGSPGCRRLDRAAVDGPPTCDRRCGAGRRTQVVPACPTRSASKSERRAASNVLERSGRSRCSDRRPPSG